VDNFVVYDPEVALPMACGRDAAPAGVPPNMEVST
jgi:hypothetical protein